VRVVPAPDELDGHQRGIAQRPEHDPVPAVLRDRALGGDADAAAGGDGREPVVDVVGVLDGGLGAGRPQAGVVVPVRRSTSSVRWPTSTSPMDRRRAQGSSAASAQ
jgi:hypothetical protein